LTWLIVIGVYLVLGVITTLIAAFRVSMFFFLPPLFVLSVLIFPYIVIVIIKEEITPSGGGWI
jgi:hypothetical protein